jgi:hypothetical protein
LILLYLPLDHGLYVGALLSVLQGVGLNLVHPAEEKVQLHLRGLILSLLLLNPLLQLLLDQVLKARPLLLLEEVSVVLLQSDMVENLETLIPEIDMLVLNGLNEYFAVLSKNWGSLSNFKIRSPMCRFCINNKWSSINYKKTYKH